MNMTEREKFAEFCDTVIKDLEYINYPDLVEGYTEESVAVPMSLTMFASFIGGMSPMLTACLIYGCTWSYQVVPETKDMVKH